MKIKPEKEKQTHTHTIRPQQIYDNNRQKAIAVFGRFVVTMQTANEIIIGFVCSYMAAECMYVS